MSEINDEGIEPDDAASIRRATATVIDRLVGQKPATRQIADEAAKAVLLVVRTGYGRDPLSQAIDADDLAEAAIARVRASQR